jgi:mono/diheme cytochrome c family protein
MTPRSKSFLLGFLAAVLLALLIAALVIVTGGYNVAATERHTAIGEWALDAAFTNSVRSEASGIAAPEFTPAMVAAGAPEYKAMCAHCHGGVGEERAGWAEGMRPEPPALVDAANAWSAAEVYWLVKHGARMTGMPAFGPTHDDATLWNIAAFVKALPEMPEAQYAAYPSEHEMGGEAEGGHSHAPGTPAHED